MKGDWRVSARIGVTAVVTALLLSGCAVGLLNGAASRPSSQGTAGSTTTQAPVATDTQISSTVRSKLSVNPSLKGLKLTADTHDGVVTLRGQVNNVEQRYAAQRDARAVKGVKAV